MKVERKLLLMSGVLALVALVSVPSVMFHDAVKKYFSFLYAWNLPCFNLSKTNTIPPPPQRPKAQLPQPELRFVEFSLKLPKAKTVEITGDFNKWEPQKMSSAGKGEWKTIMTLPLGEHRYLYRVDGKFMPDPLNSKTSLHNSKKVSVLEVK